MSARDLQTVHRQPYLILVKHSLPEIDPGRPAAQWQLCEEGRKRCQPLAKALADYNPGRIFTSHEPKAIETGQIVAAQLGLTSFSADNLHEHRRLSAAFTGKPEFEANVARFFAEPEQLVFGEETASQATNRFTKAVQQLVDLYPQETLILVSHGTVISLFYQTVRGENPYPLWQKLGLPSFLAFSLPDYALTEIVSVLAIGD